MPYPTFRAAIGSPESLADALPRAGFRGVAVEAAGVRWRLSTAAALAYLRLSAAALPPETTDR